MRKVLEQKQLVEQEKQIVVEFMHTMVEAVAEGRERSELFQRIIHAATVCTGAFSACIYYLEADGCLRGVASEGLFPPQSDGKNSEFSQERRLRSQQLESILRSESFAVGEGLVGQVAQSKRALLIANAQLDPRVYQHEDPDFQMHSLILAPVLFQGNLLAVLAVANPADGVPFNATDFSLVENLAEQAGLALHNCQSKACFYPKSFRLRST
jgi:sigma-B regulation protein RsbU (phosphoserine phosphatase)